ncbi:MAG: hypothetical protein WCR58_11395 [Bacteroidales bacterium]|jgi:broad specificity phosphatase PhoE|nr:hypothetical protein [Bacteroidales bacterium]MCK9447708.1 hypothetical protein [Bacteroidales bacterium]MDD3700213.1 hypothetical protein [Bacteroidales bacterium]MDY0370069.1 hypothetical protein [Bacteroidales bacterium]
MKFYDIDSEFTFGKYEGKTIREVFEKDPNYIEFCFNNIDEFYVSPEVMKELRQINPRYTGPSLQEMDDDVLDSYLEEIGELDELGDAYAEDEDFNWEDEDIEIDDDFDDFDSGFDDFDGDDF